MPGGQSSIPSRYASSSLFGSIKVQDEIRQGCVIALGMIGDCDGDRRRPHPRSAPAHQQVTIPASHWSLIALAQIAGRRGTGEKSDEGRRAITEHLLPP